MIWFLRLNKYLIIIIFFYPQVWILSSKPNFMSCWQKPQKGHKTETGYYNWSQFFGRKLYWLLFDYILNWKFWTEVGFFIFTHFYHLFYDKLILFQRTMVYISFYWHYSQGWSASSCHINRPSRCIWKLLLLDRNTWNHLTVCKQMIIFIIKVE